MRHCVIADIHGNLEAFQAVLEDASTKKIDKFLCIGDVVSYGADPNACIRLVKSILPAALVAGNHEWGVLGLLDSDYFTPLALEAISWTWKKLAQDELDFLKSFRLLYEDGDITLVHGTLEDPEKFNYLRDISDAYATMSLMKTRIVFVGHTHVPGFFHTENGRIGTALAASKIKIDRNEKYIVNVGSIGQPRDNDPRASYAIYDDETKSVEILRVEYDIEKAKEKILDAGLPSRLGYRLLQGR